MFELPIVRPPILTPPSSDCIGGSFSPWLAEVYKWIEKFRQIVLHWKMFIFCSLFGISFDPQESVKCDIKDTSSRKEIIVYRVPEFLYSGISWVPQRDGSKNQTLYLVNVCWNSFCTHHRVWDAIFSLKKSKSLSTTGQTLWHLYMLSPVIFPLTHMYSVEPSLRRLNCTEVETWQRR